MLNKRHKSTRSTCLSCLSAPSPLQFGARDSGFSFLGAGGEPTSRTLDAAEDRDTASEPAEQEPAASRAIMVCRQEGRE